MRFPDDTSFHLRMAALLVIALFVEHVAAQKLPLWNSPRIGVVSFVLGLAWVALAAWHHGKGAQARIRALEAKVDRLQAHVDALTDDARARRSLPR
ncbi:MAG: hypothetical protein FJ301_07140 [Planctomycetes bacterium]|nr:hypothetical protein [Planctomycetota bacterium]